MGDKEQDKEQKINKYTRGKNVYDSFSQNSYEYI